MGCSVARLTRHGHPLRVLTASIMVRRGDVAGAQLVRPRPALSTENQDLAVTKQDPALPRAKVESFSEGRQEPTKTASRIAFPAPEHRCRRSRFVSPVPAHDRSTRHVPKLREAPI